MMAVSTSFAVGTDGIFWCVARRTTEVLAFSIWSVFKRRRTSARASGNSWWQLIVVWVRFRSSCIFLSISRGVRESR